MNQLEQLHQWSIGVELADPSQAPAMAELRNKLQKMPGWKLSSLPLSSLQDLAQGYILPSYKSYPWDGPSFLSPAPGRHS